MDGYKTYLDDDENVKAMRETARTIGLTALLTDLRRESVLLLAALERDRASLSQALVLLGVSDDEEGNAPTKKAVS